MSLNTALAISLGVLGAVATWLFLGPLGGMLAIWAAFIAWGCYYHCGGKETGLQSTIICTAVGAVVAGITLTSWREWASALPRSHLDSASAWALAWRRWCCSPMSRCSRAFRRRSMALPLSSPDAMPAKAGSLTAASMANPVVVIILSMILGAVFGYVSEKVAGMLVGSWRHRAARKGLERARERLARTRSRAGPFLAAPPASALGHTA